MNQRDGLSNENRRAFWQQAICSVYWIKGRIPIIHLPAEQSLWLQWINIFTTKSQRHEAVAVAARAAQSEKSLARRITDVASTRHRRGTSISFAIGNRPLFIDHCSLIFKRSAEAYGNTLIFTAPDTTGNWRGDAGGYSSGASCASIPSSFTFLFRVLRLMPRKSAAFIFTSAHLPRACSIKAFST